jgi:hypothetical protein
MSSLDRRQFLESVAGAGIAAFAGIRTLQAADALVEVNPSQPGPVIGSHLYGHFIERRPSTSSTGASATSRGGAAET